MSATFDLDQPGSHRSVARTLRAFERIRDLGVKATLRQTDGQRRDRDPPGREDLQTLREPPAALAEQASSSTARHSEHHLARVARAPAHLRGTEARLDPGGSAGTTIDEIPSRPPAGSVAAATMWNAEIGVPAFVMNALAPSTIHSLAVEGSARPDLDATSEPRARLGQARTSRGLRRARAARASAPSVLGAEPVQHAAGESDRRRKRDAGRLVDPADLLDRQAHRDRVGVRAAVLLGERQPEQPQLAHLETTRAGVSFTVGLGRPGATTSSANSRTTRGTPPVPG